MHSHDRTLLASLGFQDRDKQDSRHDLACQYLAQPEVAARLFEFRFCHPAEVKKTSQDGSPFVRFEVVISKGQGQYKTAIGYLDLLLSFPIKNDYGDGKSFSSNAHIAVEVKITPVSIGDILRQINLYREFITGPSFVVATAFPLSENDVASLSSSGIHHVVLGDGFNQFVEQQKAAAEQAALFGGGGSSPVL